MKKFFGILASLKLAVLVISGLTIALIVATVLESKFDTATAQYWVYRSLVFKSVLLLLGINIFCVAMSRLPWKMKHIPFLLAHLGILILLAGSWITEKFGIDGMLRVSEGESSSVVELDSASLVVTDQSRAYSIPIQWLPPDVEFKPFHLKSYKLPYDLKVDQFLPHADSTVSFQRRDSSVPLASDIKPAALHLRLVGGAMKISQDFWLWEGAPVFASVQMGPAQFSIGRQDAAPIAGKPCIHFKILNDGISFSAQGSDGKKVKGRAAKASLSQKKGYAILPGWKGNPKLVIEEFILDAAPETSYHPARIQYGPQAPTSAIHLVTSGSNGVWLGLGDRAILQLPDREVGVSYYPKRVILPFAIQLNRFNIDFDPGTLSPAAYSSKVSVLDGGQQNGDAPPKEITIGMNEPLELKGYTLYQSSYEDGVPRPITSLFSVNQDPGRLWKYLGSALIVLGSILLFAAKYRRPRARGV